MTTDNSKPKLLNSLPRSALTGELVKDIGQSDSTVGTVPITSEFNDLVTEFVLGYDGRMYALAFDLTTDDPWEVVATRECETEQRSSAE